MKLKITPDRPIMFFVRVKGRKGVREYRALLDTGSEYSIIPLQDARDLGYDAYCDPASDPGLGTLAMTKTDMAELDEIVLEEVGVADLVAKNVKALACDLPRFGGVEATLGLSFLKNFKTTIDYNKGYLTIEPI